MATIESATEIRPFHVDLPEHVTAVSVFPHALYQAPRSWTERAYPNLIYFDEVDEGNHFAAWQEPEIFTNELRAAFTSLRDERRST